MNEKNISMKMYLKIVSELDRLLSRDSFLLIDFIIIN
jgi:hypothetical protein